MSTRLFTRVAVVQLAAHPAIASKGGRSPLEDPLFGAGPPDTLVPEGEPSPELDERFKALRARIRAAYLEHLRAKVGAVLERCLEWGVRVVVFPEYSIPCDLLAFVAGYSASTRGDLVIVAGTHTVDRDARKRGPYKALGAPEAPPLGQAVCPVLHRGRFIALQPKLNPAAPEAGQMKPGDHWAPVAMPDGTPGPMGILVCLDFLYRENGPHRALVGEALESCRFLAVPSWTPTHTLSEFASKAWEEARRYGRPVLYADTAGLGTNEGGGTSIFVDEGRPSDLRDFPKQVGLLDVGEEGIIVADVDLGFRRSGESRQYNWEPPVRPFAAASLVYQNHPASASYASWLENAASTLSDNNSSVEDFSDHIAASETLLQNAASLGGPMRSRRLRRMLREHGGFIDIEQFRLSTREVVLPEEALPLPIVRAAMAGAASDVVFEWLKEYRHVGLAELAERLRRAGEGASRVDAAEWTEPARQAMAALRTSILSDELQATTAPAPAAPVTREIPIIPAGIDPASLGERERDGLHFFFRTHAEGFNPKYADGSFRTVDQGDKNAEFWAEHDAAQGENEPEFPTQPVHDAPFKLVSKALLALHLSAAAVSVARELLLLATADTDGPCAIVAVVPQSAKLGGLGVLAADRASSGWTLSYDAHDDWWRRETKRVRAALEAEGLRPLTTLALEEAERARRKTALRPMFAVALDLVARRREFKLKEVGGHFVEPAVLAGDRRQPVLTALEAWLGSSTQTALLLGEFGSGKSTALAQWCASLAERSEAGGPIPVLVDLATAPSNTDAAGVLLSALSLPNDRRRRAALTLLVGSGHLLPCFDGLDEMAGPIGQRGLAERLRVLVQIASGGGKVLIASRDHYFATESELRTTTAEALSGALGGATEHMRLTVLPFDQGQVEALVRGVHGDAESAREALRRIATTYDLNDLVRRPLLLAMVLTSLDRIDPSARVAPADVYEAYLERWLEQTAEDEASLSHDQKVRFAEALAEQLWRSGEASCSWQQLRASVRDRIGRLVLPDELPASLAFLDVQGGAFFVREGEHRYRFAHRSFLEYFLARALVETLPRRTHEALVTRPLTPEVACFVGEVLRRQGDPRESRAVGAVQRWLTSAREASDGVATDAVPGRPSNEAAANAFRLLHGLARWSADVRGWVPEGANLPGVSLVGEDLRGALLPSAHLPGADLSGADLTGADLSYSDLSGARLAAARLDDALLDGADASSADFTMAVADRCRLNGTRFDGATLGQSLWTRCQWEGARLDGADLTATIFAGGTPPSTLNSQLVKRMASPTAMRPVLTRPSVGTPQSLAWDPTGKRLAIGGTQGELSIFDAASGKLLLVLVGHPARIATIAFDQAGNALASGSDDGSVRLWDITTGELLQTMLGHSYAVTSVALNARRSLLASTSVDATVRIWERTSGKLLQKLGEGKSRGSVVKFDPQGKTLVSGSEDGTIRLWDVDSGELHRTLQGHARAVRAVAFDPLGRTLASGSEDGTVCLWDAASGERLRTLSAHPSWVAAVGFRSNRETSTSELADQIEQSWKGFSGEVPKALQEYSRSAHILELAPQGEMLASSSSDTLTKVWQVASGKLLLTLQGHSSWIMALAVNPSGQTLVSGSANHTVQMWDMATGEVLRTLQGHSSWVMAIAFDSAGRIFASGSDDGTVRLWDAASGELLRTLEGHSIGATAIAFAPDGHMMASGSHDTVIRIWVVASGALVHTLLGHSSGIRSVAFKPTDGRTLASGSDDGTVRLWDAVSSEPLMTLREGTSSVTSVAFEAGGQMLASGSEDGTVCLWDAASGELQRTLRGHASGVRAVAFDPAGRTLASGSEDGTVCLWDAASGELQRTFRGHARGVRTVAFGPMGSTLISGSYDNTMRVWDIAKGSSLAVLSSDGVNNLAEAQGYFCFDGNPDLLNFGLHSPRTDGSVLSLQPGRLRDVLENPARVAAALASNPPSPEQLAADLAAAGLSSHGGAWDGKLLRVPAANDDAASGEDDPPHTPENAGPRLLGPPASSAPRLLAPPEAVGSRHLSAPEAPAPSPSPFRPGPALIDVDVLAGREPVVAELSALALCKSPAILVGPRRSGKTSLLRLVERRLKGRNPVRYVTLEGSTVTTADDLAVLLAPEPIATSGPHAGRDERPRDALLRQLRATPNPVPVFLIDEVAHLHQADAELFPWLRALGQEVAGLLFAGSQLDWVSVMRRAATVAPGSSFGNDLTAVVLGPLPEVDGERFLVETSGGVIPPEIARWVVELCGPWPFYLQVMGHALFMGAQVGQRRPFLERTALHELYEQRLLVERTAVFEGRWSELPGPVRSALRAHPDARPALRSLPTTVRTQVIDAGLCNVTGAWLSDRPFFDWVRLRAATLDEGSGTNVAT